MYEVSAALVNRLLCNNTLKLNGHLTKIVMFLKLITWGGCNSPFQREALPVHTIHWEFPCRNKIMLTSSGSDPEQK